MTRTSFAAALALWVVIVIGESRPVVAETLSAPAEQKPADQKSADKEGGKFQIRVGDDEMDPEIIKKLAPEQLESILLARASNKAKESHLESFGVPLVFFLFLGGILGLRLFLAHRRDTQRYDMLRFMVEKGTQIPPELIHPPAPRANDLRRGLLLVGTGIGLSLFLGIAHVEGHAWSVGFIPLLVGAGYLTAWKLDQNQKS